jgi:hypothetical protein
MTTAPTTSAAPTGSTVPTGRSSWSAARTALVVVGSVLALSGLGALAGGGAVAWAGQQRDGDGYLTSDPGHFTTDTYAISATSLDFDVTGPDVYGEGQLGEVRIQVRSRDRDASVFVGIGPASDVAAYLDRVKHVEVSDLDSGPFEATYTQHAGGRPGTAPEAQTFWAATDAGIGPQTLTWPIATGDWTVVIMNSDASAGVDTDVSAAARVPFLRTAAVIAFVFGGVLLIAGIAMIVAPFITRGSRRTRHPAAAPADPR